MGLGRRVRSALVLSAVVVAASCGDGTSPKEPPSIDLATMAVVGDSVIAEVRASHEKGVPTVSFDGLFSGSGSGSLRRAVGYEMSLEAQQFSTTASAAYDGEVARRELTATVAATPLAFTRSSWAYDEAAQEFVGELSVNYAPAAVVCDDGGVGVGPLSGAGRVEPRWPFVQGREEKAVPLACSATYAGAADSVDLVAVALALPDVAPVVAGELVAGRLSGDDFVLRVVAEDDWGLTSLRASVGDSVRSVAVSGLSAEAEFSFRLPAGEHRAELCAADDAGQVACVDVAVRSLAAVDVAFDVVDALSAMVPEIRVGVGGFDYVVRNQLDELVASGVGEGGFTVRAGVGDSLRASLLHEDYLPHVVALGGDGFFVANHPVDGFGVIPVDGIEGGSFVVRSLMVRAEELPYIDCTFYYDKGQECPYESVEALIRHFGNNVNVGGRNVSWVVKPRVWAEVHLAGPIDTANLVHGVGLLRTCARAGDVGPVDDLGEVLYMDRAPSVEERVNTIHMRRDPESPGYAISLSHQFRVPLRNHPDSASVGYSSFRWRNPEVTWTHGGFGDVVALYGIEARDGSDSPLVKLSTIYPPLSRYGEVVCSVVPNFPLLYRFPTAAELASPTVSLSAHGPPQRSRRNWP